jgi:AraC-like DNA-binding protein
MSSMFRRPSISMVLVRPLATALANTPKALATFFASTDLTPQMLDDAEARVSSAQFCVAWAEAIRLSGDPSLALRIAEATPAGAFGIVEYVCRSSVTLREALRQWVRYLGILDDAVEVGLIETETHGALRVVTESEAPAPASHELCFALIVRHARAMVQGGVRIVEVRFSHQAKTAQLSRYGVFFESEVRFGATHTELVFEQSTLDTPLTTADPNLLAILLSAATERSGRPSSHLPLTDQVRRALRSALSHDDAEVERIAQRLGMTGRTLQRRLKDEETSFQAVRDDMRRELADRYLGEGMSFAEISFLLGFSEPSAFFRAFKRWTGLTPFERRSELLRA